MLGVIPVATTRVPKKWGTALYSLGIFFLMFCFQMAKNHGLFFINYRFKNINIVVVFILSVIFTVAYYLGYKDMVTIGKIIHYMSIAVVISFLLYRAFILEWVYKNIGYVFDGSHLTYCICVQAGVLTTLSTVRLLYKDGNLGYNQFFAVFIKGAMWLFVLCFAFVFFINRPDMGIEYTVNLVPFQGELKTVFDLSDSITNDVHLLGNVAFFSLFSFLIASSTLRKRKLLSLAIPVVTSITMELVQYIFYIGDPDIDDVIANTLGAILGVAAYQIVSKYLLSKERDAV